jgi:hypothetical protein
MEDQNELRVLSRDDILRTRSIRRLALLCRERGLEVSGDAQTMRTNLLHDSNLQRLDDVWQQLQAEETDLNQPTGGAVDGQEEASQESHLQDESEEDQSSPTEEDEDSQSIQGDNLLAGVDVPVEFDPGDHAEAGVRRDHESADANPRIEDVTSIDGSPHPQSQPLVDNEEDVDASANGGVGADSDQTPLGGEGLNFSAAHLQPPGGATAGSRRDNEASRRRSHTLLPTAAGQTVFSRGGTAAMTRLFAEIADFRSRRSEVRNPEVSWADRTRHPVTPAAATPQVERDFPFGEEALTPAQRINRILASTPITYRYRGPESEPHESVYDAVWEKNMGEHLTNDLFPTEGDKPEWSLTPGLRARLLGSHGLLTLDGKPSLYKWGMSRESKVELLEKFTWPTDMNSSAFRMPTLDASVIKKMTKTDQDVSKAIYTAQACFLEVIRVAVNGMQQMESELESLKRRGFPDNCADVRRTYNAFISFSTTVILAASYCGWASDQRTRAAYRAVGVTAPPDGKPIYQRSFDSDRASAMEPGEEDTDLLGDTAVRAVAGGPQGARRRAIWHEVRAIQKQIDGPTSTRGAARGRRGKGAGRWKPYATDENITDPPNGYNRSRGDNGFFRRGASPAGSRGGARGRGSSKNRGRGGRGKNPNGHQNSRGGAAGNANPAPNDQGSG